MITHQAIVSNAQKSYDEQRDLGELIQEHRDNEEAMLEINQEKQRALVLAKQQQLEDEEENALTG